MPPWDQTGVPINFHSSAISGSASWTISRTFASIFPRQSLSSLILSSINLEADSAVQPAARAAFCVVISIRLFAFTYSTLRGVGRPRGGLNAELLGVLRIQSLPTVELHRVRAGDAADGSSTEQVIQTIERNVPPGSAH